MSASTARDLLAIVRRGYEEGWNSQRLEVLDELLTEDFRGHDPSVPGGVVRRDDVREIMRQIYAAFPDVRREVLDAVAEGDKIAVRWQVTGTHRGPYAGTPATGRRIEITGITFYRIAGDRIAEEWVAMDTAALARQLGTGA